MRWPIYSPTNQLLVGNDNNELFKGTGQIPYSSTNVEVSYRQRVNRRVRLKTSLIRHLIKIETTEADHKKYDHCYKRVQFIILAV